MIDKLGERRAIAARLDNREKLANSIRELPDVKMALEKRETARLAYDEAQREFDELWEKNYISEEDLVRAIQVEHPEVMTLGDDDWPLIACCAVTNLPIFKGDRVHKLGNRDNYNLIYVLADAVQIDPALAIEPTVASADD